MSATAWTELLARPAEEVAPLLLGSVLVVRDEEGEVAIRLTEVEAYSGTADPGSHAYRGRTERTAPMFGPGGHLYVYLSYGMHHCCNIVCSAEGVASALLVRAGEVVRGHALARARRPAARNDRELARGPGRLAQAAGLVRTDSGRPLEVGGRAELEVAPSPDPARVLTGPRVGVAGPGGDGAAFPWRFWLDGEPTVSVYRRAVTRTRRRTRQTGAQPAAGPRHRKADQ